MWLYYLVRQSGRSFDYITKFAHIAGPWMGGKHSHRVGGKCGVRFELAEKVGS